MAKLRKTGYILSVYTDYDVFNYHFDNITDATEQCREYLKTGCQARITINYTTE